MIEPGKAKNEELSSFDLIVQIDANTYIFCILSLSNLI